jgi:hypothetical protein
MSDEEREKIENAWDEDFYEGLEQLGWSNDDTEYSLQGPLRLVNKDTGEEFSVLDGDGNIIPKEKTEKVEEDSDIPLALDTEASWPFPTAKTTLK